jgi:translation initiation factor IF-2
MEKKLIEVAKEFNVSKDSIAEFLASKGYPNDNRPIAKVTEPMYAELTKKFQDSLSEKKKAEQISIGERDRHRHHHQNHGHQNQPKKDLSHLPPKKESLLITQMPTKNAEVNPTNQNGTVVTPPVAPPPTPVFVEEKKVVTPPIAPNGSDKERDRKIPDLRQLPGLRVMGKIDLTPRKKEVPPPAPLPLAPKKEERNDRPNDRGDRNDRNESRDRNNDNRGGDRNNENRVGDRNNENRSGDRNNENRSGDRNNENRSGDRNNENRSGDRNNENRGGDRNNDNRGGDRNNNNDRGGDRNNNNDRGGDRNYRNDRGDRRDRDRNRQGDNQNRPEVKAELPPVAPPPVKVEPVVPEKVVEERIEPELVRADIPQLKGLQIKGKIDLAQINPSDNRERGGRRRDRRDRDRDRRGPGQGLNTTGGQNNPVSNQPQTGNPENSDNRSQNNEQRNPNNDNRNQNSDNRNQNNDNRNQGGGDRRDRDRNRDRNRNNEQRPQNPAQPGTDADKEKVIIIPQMTTAQQTGQPSEEARKRRRKRRKVSTDGLNVQGQGGENRNQGGGENRNQGGGENRNQGGGENRNQGGGENRNQGSGENRNQGSGENRNQGSGENRNQGGGDNRNQGGGNYQNRQGGGGDNRNQGGGQGTNNNNSGQNRSQGGGNYQNRQGGGGDNRNQGSGQGTNNNNSSQNRTQGGGGGNQRPPYQGQGGDNRNRPTNNTGSNTGSGTNNNSGRNDNRGTNNLPPRREEPPKEITQKHIDDKIKETMARLSVVSKNKGQKIRRDKREVRREREQQRRDNKEIEKLQVAEFISVSDLASLMNVSAPQVITTCMGLGIMVSINQRLDAELIEVVAAEFGHEVEFVSAEEQITDALIEEADNPADLEERAPVVTVMGHVDHGKTSLLDYIRSAKVAQGEAGGITQHIGAYEVVTKDDKKITFLDTPGHEAFTAMRARGAKVTDVAVIIISADDDIMPQTKEAISHAQAAGVPMVFAINKIDKPGANPENIKRRLSEMNILVEDWGGKFQSQDISAKKGTNVDALLEKILLEAEILDLKANPNKSASGTVIEASLDKGRGYVTKMLVQMGTLKIGDAMVAGEHSGKVKAMFNERGKRLKTAGPSTPILVLGLSGAPQAGEKFKVLPSESDAREIATKRAQIIREQSTRSAKRMSLEEIGRRLALGNFKELNLIVKGDFDGSVEALSDSLLKQSQTTVQVKVIHKAVGPITESDVLLASASDAIIVGFQVRPSPMARKLAERDGVEIKMYSIIYEAIDEIRSAIEGMLVPNKEEKVMGQVEVREIFKISKIGTIAGAYVQEGKITRNALIRVIRQGIVVFPMKEGATGQLGSLKRFKDDMKEVKFGFECGLTIDNYNDIQIGDILEAYEIIEVKQKMI